MPDWAQIIFDALDILKFDGAVQDTLAQLREKWGAQVPALLEELKAPLLARKDRFVLVSMAAGITIETIQKITGTPRARLCASCRICGRAWKGRGSDFPGMIPLQRKKYLRWKKHCSLPGF